MNIYDFDGTIYNGDSTIDFWKFCLIRHPIILFTIPRTLFAGIEYKFFDKNLEYFKSIFFRFLQFVPNITGEVKAFWDKNQDKICPWYLSQQKNSDVIISASPEFLLKECCRRLGVNLIATSVNEKNGDLKGKNCKGEEKVRQFKKLYPDALIEDFYTDSLSDTPMTDLAKRSFIVKNGKILLWKSGSI